MRAALFHEFGGPEVVGEIVELVPEVDGGREVGDRGAPVPDGHPRRGPLVPARASGGLETAAMRRIGVEGRLLVYETSTTPDDPSVGTKGPT